MTHARRSRLPRRSAAFVALALLASGLNPLAASSGETEFVIDEQGRFTCHRSMWANQYAPPGMGCPEIGPSGQDLIPGVVFVPAPLQPPSVTFVNGWPVAKATFQAAIRPGAHGLIHHERGWAQHQSINSANDFDEGLIQAVDLANQTVTVLIYTNLPASCVESELVTFPYHPNALLKYEGTVGPAADTLVAGRHVRLYSPRPQTIFAFSAIALQGDRSASDKPLGWVRQGFAAGVLDGTVYFAEQRGGEWLDSFAVGVTSDVDSYRLSPEGAGALMRPGDRLITSPRITGNAGANTGAHYGHFLPMDDGSVIGTVVALGTDTLTVRTIASPTGRAADVVETDVTIPLDSDAVYHLDGRTGGTREDALSLGRFVRVLPAIPHGMLCVRDTGSVGLARFTLSAAPSTHGVLLFNNPVELTNDNVAWSQPTTVTVLENEFARFRAWLYTRETTAVVWLRNGQPIPGSSQSLATSDFLNFSELADLGDAGAVFQCLATTSNGVVRSPEITLQVLPNTSPFLLSGANVVSADTVLLAFNRAAARGDGPNGAENPANYVFSSGVTVQSATLTGDRRTVVLQTSPLTPGAVYNISVSHVQDTSATPVTIAPASIAEAAFQVKFRYYRFTLLGRSTILAPRLQEIRYLADGVAYGLGAESFGVENSAQVHDGQLTNITLSVGDAIVTDLGLDPIAAEAVSLDLSPQETRQITSFRIDGSNDAANWVELVTHNAVINTDTVVPIDLSPLRPEDILTGAKEPQVITFPALPDVPLSAGSIRLGAGSSSGLPITYDVIAGPAVINGTELTVTAVGRVDLQATQAGDASFYSAHPEFRSFEVLAAGAAPVARPVGTPASGFSPLSVAFDGRASSDPDGGTIVTYAWSFGDGQSATGAEVNHTYATPGVYIATLTVTDNSGQSGAANTVVTALAPPTEPQAAFAATPGEGYTPLEVSFDASASNDPNGTLISYVWDFGDGQSGTGASLTHTYTSAGNFTARLTVTDNDGQTDTTAQTIRVTATVAPTILAEPLDQQAFAGATVTFSVGVTGTPAPTFQWRRNGSPISGAVGSTLSFTALLADNGASFDCVVSNLGGSKTSRAASLTVAEFVPTAPQFTLQPLPTTVNEGSVATFQVAVIGAPTPTLQWWRDGAPLDGQTSSTLTVVATLADDGAEFSCVATNTEGSTPSTTVTLRVNPAAGGGVISVNFGANTLGEAEVAGVVPVARWNNVSGTTTATNLVTQAGLQTAVAVQVSGNQLSEYVSADNPATNGDYRMMSSYRGTQSSTFTVTLTGLPTAYQASGYDVIAYFGARNDGAIYKPEYVIGTEKRYLLDNTGTWDGVHRESTATSTAAAQAGDNYVRWRGMNAASFTLSVNKNGGPQRYGISGLQIVQRTPPTAPIMAVVQIGSVFQFSFNSEPGITYQLRTSSTLSQPFSDWNAVGAEVAGDGSLRTIELSTEGLISNPVRFFVLEARSASSP